MTLLDPTGRAISMEQEYLRIVCLVPSITDLLCELGLEDRIVGVTTFCVHPSHIKKSSSVIGGTKTPRLDRILSLKPDIIIANQEENNEADVLALEQSIPAYVSIVKTIQDNEALISDLGEIFKIQHRADGLTAQIALQREHFGKPEVTSTSALYFIWKGPYMSAGGDTFIHAMMTEMGLKNLMAQHLRYPQMTREELEALQPDLVLLSSEPYPFKEKDKKELQEIWPSAKVLLVDGELFSWYGSRIAKSYAYFNELWQQIAP